MITLRHKSNENVAASSGRFEWRDIGLLARENNLQFVQGMCLPASCSSEAVIKYSTDVVSEAKLEAVAATCRTNDPIPFNPIDYFAM